MNEELDENFENSLQNMFLSFNLGSELYALEIRFVKEIIGIQKITKVPDTPSFIKGVINLRGKVIPLMDVRLRFGLDEIGYNERTCVIVVEINEVPIGLIVDTVSEVQHIDNTSMEALKVKQNSGNPFIMGMAKTEDTVKILIDVQKLVFLEELEAVQALGQ